MTRQARKHLNQLLSLNGSCAYSGDSAKAIRDLTRPGTTSSVGSSSSFDTTVRVLHFIRIRLAQLNPFGAVAPDAATRRAAATASRTPAVSPMGTLQRP